MTAPVVPFCKPFIDEQEVHAVARVVHSGQLAQGPEVAKLEQEFAELIGVKHAVACSSGTAALFLALKAAGVGFGNKVITTPFSFVATASSIMMCGATPVFADIDEETFNIDPARVEALIVPSRKFSSIILPVHLFGRACDVEKLRDLDPYDALVIEDCAQAIAATSVSRTLDGGGIVRRVGSLGVAGCFSLYATKNVMAGEGGMVTTNDPAVADRVRRLRQHGYTDVPYMHDRLGWNLRMSDLHAAIARVQLRKLGVINLRRLGDSERYFDALRDVPEVILPIPCDGHAWHQFTVRVKNRDRVAAYLRERGVGCGIFYPVPLNRQPFIREAFGEQPCPVAERLAGEVLQLPIYPGLSTSDVDRVVEVLKEAVRVQ